VYWNLFIIVLDCQAGSRKGKLPIGKAMPDCWWQNWGPMCSCFCGNMLLRWYKGLLLFDRWWVIKKNSGWLLIMCKKRMN